MNGLNPTNGQPDDIYKHNVKAANMALFGMSDNQRITFALIVILDVKDPNETARLRFAANRISESCNILVREAFEAECG
jgi:hypothetical protein